MAWIESHQSLGEHPKTKKLCRLLSISKVQAVGHLHMLWWWALEYAQDGNLTKFDADDLADAIEWPGDGSALLAGLIRAGFVDVDQDGVHELHDWSDYAGRLLEQRETRAQRSRRNRGLYNDDELIKSIRSRDGSNCRYCGVAVDWKDRKGQRGGTYDHVDPYAENENSYDNVVVACRSCNAAKGKRTPDQAGMKVLPPLTSNNLPSSAVNQPTLTITNRTNQTKPTEPESTPLPPGTSQDRWEQKIALFEAYCRGVGIKPNSAEMERRRHLGYVDVDTVVGLITPEKLEELARWVVNDWRNAGIPKTPGIGKVLEQESEFDRSQSGESIVVPIRGSPRSRTRTDESRHALEAVQAIARGES